MSHIVFCADEHLLVRRKGVPGSFERDRYGKLFSTLLDLSDNAHCEAVIHGGDLFDRAPSLAEVSIAVNYLNNVTKPTYIIDGNHCATKKGETFLGELRAMVTNPLVTIITEFCSYEIGNRTVDFIPFNRLKAYEKDPSLFIRKGDLLVTHVRGEIPPHVKAEVDLSIFDPWKLVLAGDLHSHSCSQRNIVYPGSPLATSFYRDKAPEKGVLLVDLNTLEYTFKPLDLPALIRVTVESKEEIGPVYDGKGNFIDYEVISKQIASICSDVVDEDEIQEIGDEDLFISTLDALASIIEGDAKEGAIEKYVEITRNRG